MAQDELEIIEAAVQMRLLTKKQAEMIREELEFYPGQKAGSLMLRRHYITEEQLKELYDMGGGETLRTSPDGGAAPVQGGRLFDNDSAPPSASQLAAQRGGGAPQQQSAPQVAQQQPPAAQGAPQQLSVAQLRAGAAPPPNPRQPAATAGREAPAPAPAQAPTPAPAAAPATASAQNFQMPKNLVGFLRLARHWGASDLHLSVGRPPFVRISGQIRYMEMAPLTAEASMALNFSALTEVQRATAEEQQQLDFALEIRDVGRHRCNVFRQRLGWDGVYRIVRSSIPTIEELGLPPSVKQFTEYHQGLVMVTGPGGSGKTTTAAALLDLVNISRRDHIITVEDPVEYVLPPKNCQVTQREVGRHTQSFANALRAALREDPDIILVGELRDLETTSISISAAETGHLVFSTMHTSSAARTVARIVDVYPVNQQSQVCTMVAESLRGVITQQLIPHKQTGLPVMALEIMVNISGIAQQIKESKTHMISSLIQSGKKYGMMLMDDSLMNMYRQQSITGRDAYKRCNNKNLFESIKDLD